MNVGRRPIRGPPSAPSASRQPTPRRTAPRAAARRRDGPGRRDPGAERRRGDRPAAWDAAAPTRAPAAGTPAGGGGEGAPQRCSPRYEASGPERPSVPGPQLAIDVTEEGVLISLTDRQNFSMFALGSAEPQPRVVRMMEAIAMSLEAMPGAIVVRGHTDAPSLPLEAYDNWRLSVARAQMAYYMLTGAAFRRTASTGSRASPTIA